MWRVEPIEDEHERECSRDHVAPHVDPNTGSEHKRLHEHHIFGRRDDRRRYEASVFGTPAIVDYEPGGSPKPTYRLQLTVLGIKKGSQTELDGVELEKSEQGKTPYYVTLRIQNIGSGDAAAEENQPAAAFQAIDDRGQQGQELTVLGNFRPCPNVNQPKQFTRGVTYQTCVIYMVGGNGSIVQEQWTGNGADAYSENPIVWKAS